MSVGDHRREAESGGGSEFVWWGFSLLWLSGLSPKHFLLQFLASVLLLHLEGFLEGFRSLRLGVVNIVVVAVRLCMNRSRCDRGSFLSSGTRGGLALVW